MNEDEYHVAARRQFALDKAVATTVGHERPQDIVARAEAFDAFLRGGKPSESST